MLTFVIDAVLDCLDIVSWVGHDLAGEGSVKYAVYGAIKVGLICGNAVLLVLLSELTQLLPELLGLLELGLRRVQLGLTRIFFFSFSTHVK